jgi:hypothetical protein
MEIGEAAQQGRVEWKKGYPESQARKLLTLVISFFSN